MTDRKARTEGFADLGWGVFTHYIHESPTGGTCAPNTRNHFTQFRDWNDRVNHFNTDTYARILHEVGARYAFFTVMQGTPFLCAPNDTYNQITGARPGESCSERDLIADLIASLDKYNIPLFLYYTGDGPYKDPVHGRRMGYHDREVESVNMPFVKNWTAVLKEYALRYGKGVHGWWVDGMFQYLGYEDPALFVPYRESCLAGNPDAIVAFNNGVAQPDTKRKEVQKYLRPDMGPLERVRALEAVQEKDPLVMEALSKRPRNSYRYSEYEDFCAGETDDFTELPPEDGMVDGSRWHVLGFLGQYRSYSPVWYGDGWNCLGSRYSGAYMRDYVRKCNERRGVVSIDMFLFDDGSFDEAQLEVVCKINE